MKTKYILTKDEQEFFFQTINSLIYSKEFLTLKKYRHHGNISIYTHAIKVAYLSYKYAVRHKMKIHQEELIIAALLHDLYFYDWHDKHNGVHLHGLFHPAKAVKNASRIYGISKRIQRHMRHHMFPLTLIPPTTKEGWLICIFDKVATKSDYKALRLKKKALKQLRA